MTRKKIKNFWNNVLSSDDPTSSKRLITLILSAIFILAQLAILFIAFYVVFYTIKGKVDVDLLHMLDKVLEYDFYIILSGLGFITADNLGQILLERAKAKVAGNMAVGAPNADTINVENMKVEQQIKPPVEQDPEKANG